MAITYRDPEITSLVAERKSLPTNWARRISLKQKRGHSEGQLGLVGAAGSSFRLIFRQSSINPFDFSIILAVQVPHSNRLFRIRRYNGKSHEHTNRIEDVRFYDFHIHIATERYQAIGKREDAYAEPTDRYSDYHGALCCLLKDVNLGLPPESQLDLFMEV